MKNLSRAELNKDLKKYVGPHTKLKFTKDNNWYWFKNFNTNFDGVFLTLPGVGVKFKKIKDIIEIWNGQLFKIEDSPLIIENNKEDQLERGIEIEKEHLPTYNKIKEYYSEFKKLPNKEEFYSWIAKDHIDEFKEDDYYKALEQMEEELKNKVITEEVDLDQCSLQEADETVPEITELEKKEEIVSNRQEIENIIGNIEAVLLNEKSVLIPPKVNYILRLNNVLTALKSLRNDLDVYSKIIQENKDMKFSKEDVRLVLETNYRIIDKKDQLYKIAVRNVFKENKNDLFNYSLEVFFDDNCLMVNPVFITEVSKKLCKKIYTEICDDLNAIKENNEIILEEQEGDNSFDQYNLEANKYITKVLTQYGLKKDEGIIILDTSIEKQDGEFADNENIQTEVTIFLTTKPIEEYNFDQVLVDLSYSFFNNLIYSKGDTFTPEYSENEKQNEKIEVREIYVNGDKIELSEQNKILIKEIDWKSIIS